MTNFFKDTWQITINQNDYGNIVTFVLKKNAPDSTFKFDIYDNADINIITKTVSPNENNRLEINITKEESGKLSLGNHYWSLVQYVNGKLFSTLLIDKIFRVEKGKHYYDEQ